MYDITLKSGSISNISLPKSYPLEKAYKWIEFEEKKTADARFAKAMDRCIPTIINVNNNFQSWSEHDVKLEQVIAVNSEIANAHPEIWGILKEQIEAGAVDGGFEKFEN